MYFVQKSALISLMLNNMRAKNHIVLFFEFKCIEIILKLSIFLILVY